MERPLSPADKPVAQPRRFSTANTLPLPSWPTRWLQGHRPDLTSQHECIDTTLKMFNKCMTWGYWGLHAALRQAGQLVPICKAQGPENVSVPAKVAPPLKWLKALLGI